MKLINVGPNHQIIIDNGKEYFLSYGSIIVIRKDGKVYLNKEFWDYSVTTRKYRNKYLAETKNETSEKIDSGKYILVSDEKIKTL